MRMQPETTGLAVKGRTPIALTNFFPILYHAEVHRLPNPYTRLLECFPSYRSTYEECVDRLV